VLLSVDSARSAWNRRIKRTGALIINLRFFPFREVSQVEVLRRCNNWLQRLEHGENVVVNLRPDEDFETEFVAFDRPRAGTNRS
jgi:hypothetical protein